MTFFHFSLDKEGSFSRAAETLNISQPSLSQYIRKIENEVGIPLFDRTGVYVRLTAAGAKSLSGSVLLFTAGIAVFYALLVSGKKNRLSLSEIAQTFSEHIKGLVPTIATCILGYIIGAMFSSLGVSEQLEEFILGMQLNRFGMVICISLLTCFLGMVIPGSSLTVMFGPLFITVFSAVGIEPLLAAAMLPCICGAMGNITPPFALCMYAGMGIAESDFSKTVKNDIWWVLLQFVLQVVLLMGRIPVLGI